MKYWELIKVAGLPATSEKENSNTSVKSVNDLTPAEITERNDAAEKALNAILEKDRAATQELNNNIVSIMKCMEELKNKTCSPPDGFENTQLNDDEIEDVLVTILEYKNKYFNKTPLTETLVKSFMWNIPKEVYKAHKKIKLMDDIDQLDPLFWLYCTCLEDPEEMMSMWITQAINSFNDDSYNHIDNLNKEYETAHNECYESYPDDMPNDDETVIDDNEDNVEESNTSILDSINVGSINIDSPDEAEYISVDPDKLVMDITDTSDLDLYKK